MDKYTRAQLETCILLLEFVSALPFEVISKLDTLQLNLFTVELKLLSSHVVKSGQTIIAKISNQDSDVIRSRQYALSYNCWITEVTVKSL